MKYPLILFPAIFIVSLAIILSCTSNNGVRVNVTNEDPETINQLHIYASDKVYLVENIAPGETKNITIQIKGKTKVLFMADSGVVLGNSMTYLAPIEKGIIDVTMTKDKIISRSSYRID